MNKPSPLDNVRIVLSHTSHPGNIGAAARAMKTMGLHDLRLVSPKCFPDPEATARATGSADLLENAQVCASVDEALDGTVLAVALSGRRRDLSLRVITPRELAPLLISQAENAPVALLFGNETAGLSNAEVNKCQYLVSIPTNPECASLNLAAAVQVLCYELRMALPDLPVVREVAKPLANFEDVERFYSRLEAMLIETEFLDPEQPKRLMHRIRRMFARGGIEPEELAILQGILTALRNG